MRQDYTILVTGVIIFLMAAIKYRPSRLIQIESFCDSKKQICVHCPKLQNSSSFKAFVEIDSIVMHNSAFRALVCDKQVRFQMKSCEGYLQFIDSNLQLEQNSGIIQKLDKEEIFYEKSQKYAIFSAFSYYFIEPNEDYIIYTRENGRQRPKIYKQSEQNAEILLFFAKVINQSALIAFIIATIMCFIGFSCFSFSRDHIPLLQLLILSASFTTSTDSRFFECFHLTKALFLVILSTKMINGHRYFKILTILWLILCFLLPKCIIIGYFYIFYQIRKTKTSELKSILSIIFAIFLSLSLLSIIPFSLFSFACLLWEVIFLPILLVTFQDESTTGINDSFQ